MDQGVPKGLGSRIKEGLIGHIVDSTAIMVEATPIFAASETGISGMSYDTSLNSRILSAGLVFGGLGLMYSKGRDAWRAHFKITGESRERVQQISDLAYTGLFNLVCMPGVYLLSGARDPKEIAIGTVAAAAIGGLNGIPQGYSVDLFRDLTGLKKSERVPDFISERSPNAKRGLAALLLGTSVGLTTLIYKTLT